MKKLLALLAAFLLLFCLAACGGKVDPSDPNQGLWRATTGEMMGFAMEVEEFFGEGFTIELQSNGKCAINVDGEKANGTWTLDGGAFTVKGGGLDCSGRLENGLLTLENVLDMGLSLVFEKEGGYPGGAAAPADAPAAASAGVPGDTPAAGDAGYYVIDSMIQAGDTIGSDLLPAFGMEAYYVVLNEDGTTELHTDSVIMGTWEPGILTYVENGEELIGEYTLDGDLLSIELGGADVVLVFKRSSNAPPASGSAGGAGSGDLSDLQRQWNGTWYGFMMFNGGTGAYEEGAGDADMYMVVDIDAEGSGTFTVYSAYSMGEWGKGACIAREDVLEVVDGELTSSPEPMVPADWTFYRVQDSENKIVNTSDFTDFNGDTFNYSLFFKPWGADWQDEVDSGRPVYPPGYDEYVEKINNGEPSPFDL